jgi:hypothetical protein
MAVQRNVDKKMEEESVIKIILFIIDQSLKKIKQYLITVKEQGYIENDRSHSKRWITFKQQAVDYI